MKEHKHHYILDSNSFGVCECGATYQFPVDTPKWRASEVRDIENLPPIQGVDTYSLGGKYED